MTLGMGEVITLLLALAAMLGMFGRLLLRQLDKRFEILDEHRRETRQHWDARFSELDALARENEREVLKLRADLPNEYVRREDWIRFSGTIDSKLDTLNIKIDALRERNHARN